MTTTKTTSLNRSSITLLVLLILTTGLVGCASSDGEGEGSEASRGVPVELHSVETRTLNRTVEAVGSLNAIQTVQVSPEIAGRIESLSFKEGDTVVKGDTLVQLDDDLVHQQYEASRHALDEAQANLQNASRTYRRNKRLHDKNMISEQELDNARAAYEAAQARVERLKAEVDQARERLKDTTLYAPFDGIIGSKRVDEGNYVSPGTSISTLYRTEVLEIEFSVPERYAGQLQTGQVVRVRSSSNGDTGFAGRVFFVSPSVDESTRDIVVKAYIDNGKHLLKPGSFVNVTLILETLQDRPVVPAESLIGTREGYVVYRVEDGVAQRQSVQTGLRRLGSVEITEGLQAGDRIIRSGHISVTEGTEVYSTNGE